MDPELHSHLTSNLISQPSLDELQERFCQQDQPAESTTHVTELERLSLQMCQALQSRDYNHPVFKRFPPSYRHWTNDCQGFSGPASHTEGITLQQLLDAREFVAERHPDYSSQLQGAHTVDVQTAMGAKMSMCFTTVFVGFKDLAHRMGEGVVVFRWMRKGVDETWICTRTTALRHSVGLI